MRIGKFIGGLFVLVALAGIGTLLFMEESDDSNPRPRVKRRRSPKKKSKTEKARVPLKNGINKDVLELSNPDPKPEPKPIIDVSREVKVEDLKNGSGTVNLLVVDHLDNALKNAFVKARSSVRGILGKYRTDENGKITFKDLKESEKFSAEVWHPRFDGARFVGPYKINTRIKLVFPPSDTGTIEARFMTQDQRPLTKGRLFVMDYQGRAYDYTAEGLGVDGGGRMRVELAPGRWAIYGKAPGFSETDKMFVTVKPNETQKAYLKFLSLGTISGVVIGDGGGGLDFVFELVHQTGRKKNPFTSTKRVNQPASFDGSFTLKDMNPGRYKVRASFQQKPEYASKWTEFELKPGGSMEIRLEMAKQMMSVSGSVVDYSGNRVPGVKVRCQTVECLTDEKGDFQLYGLPKGFQIVRFEKEGYSRGSREVVVVDTHTQRMLQRLSQYGVVIGRIVGTGNEPAAGVRVLLTNQNPDREGEIVTARTNDQGWYRFDKVEAGPYSLSAGSVDEKNSPRVNVQAGKTVRVPDLRGG
ncbi:MAG: carboxypeptidase-like regulatory domain-containing protein [Planctomycetota bacterium]|nr:carboxypeptidase-like regulatory domain-containing protein [Planctomycetota bacterium]